MKSLRQFLIAIAITIASSGDNTAQATAQYRLASILPWISKNSTSVDLGIIVNGTYYLSDRTNAAVHVVDLASSTEIGQITGFKGATIINGSVNKPTSGPNGLLYIPGRNELYVGDGDGSVKIVDLSNNTIVDTVLLGISKRADEMTYDTNNKLAIVTGPDDDIAILALSLSLTVNQPGIPQMASFTSPSQKVTPALVARSTSSKPLTSPQRKSCPSQIAAVTVSSSALETNGSATGAADLKVGIIDAATGILLQTLKTDNITAHAVAVDPKTNKMVVPLVGKGITIYEFVNGTSTATARATPATATPTALTASAARPGACSISLFTFLLLLSLALA